MLTDEDMPVADYHKWYKRKGNDIELRVSVLEDFLGNDMNWFDVMTKYDISKDFLYRTLREYYKKPDFCMTLISKV